MYILSSDNIHKCQCVLEAEDETDVTEVEVKVKDDYEQKVTKVIDRFDMLLWEVEVTPKVVDFFKNTKRNSVTNRLAAARTICKLAEGMRNEHFCVSSVMKNLSVCLKPG